MSDLFYYKRKVRVKRVVTEKEMVAREDMGAGYEEKEVQKEVETDEIVWDCFNINCVVRGTWVTEDIFTILLNDGHHQEEPTKIPLFGKGGQPNGGYRTETKPVWYVSQVELDKEDAMRLTRYSGDVPKNQSDLVAVD